MKFEHLIEMNDLQNPLVTPITREQLWNGLVLRAESPRMFVTYLDDCTITARELDGLSRTLHYGELKIVDQVQFEFLNFVHYHIPAQAEILQSCLRMSIEEPQTGALFIRFSYDDGHNEQEDLENVTVNEYRRSAYIEADIDTARVIRELAAAGRLDSLLS